MTSAPVDLLAALDGVDVRTADVLTCNDLLRDHRRLQGWLDAHRAQVTSRLDELARQGESFGSEASHTRCSGMSGREATKQKGRAEAIAQADGFGEALSEGDVTAEHVDKLASVASGLSDHVKAALFGKADELLDQAKSNDPGRFGRHVRDLANRLEADAGIRRGQQQRVNTWLTIELNTGTGMYDVRGALHPELGHRLKTAVRNHVAAMVAAGEASGDAEFVNRTINRNRLAAEALGELVAAGKGEIRPAVVDVTVLIDAHTLSSGEFHDHTVCETGDGAPLPVGTVHRLICNASVTGAVTGPDGKVLDIGRTARTPNRAQRRALRAMYRTCACQSCDVEFDRCELHHIVPWEAGGPTDLTNLLPACSRHHHLIHSLGWRLRLDHDRTLTITDHNDHIVMVTQPDMPHPSRHRRRTQPSEAIHQPIAS